MSDTMNAVNAENELVTTNRLQGAPKHFAGLKLVVVGGSSGMGRQTA
jgi:hypothetical protein